MPKGEDSKGNNLKRVSGDASLAAAGSQGKARRGQ